MKEKKGKKMKEKREKEREGKKVLETGFLSLKFLHPKSLKEQKGKKN